ncbi:hypothetical protein COCON_G00041170 [Conger conger]|uniref:receptor protein-tyrosine kinase n=1 Tax=Conger conger TaxID=82655 RepID=A0A9Q1DTP1_CONCO|nr:macrophage colony-stimulating factor 1 receptor [Conger conger]KAJ8281598.1 hypothetical protein COCON_G00041170 [Conger conger]
MLVLILVLEILLCAAQEWQPPEIRLNSGEVLDQPELVLSRSTSLVLRCTGSGAVTWVTRLARHKKHISKGPGKDSVLRINNLTAEHTGTYTCEYQARPGLQTSVHVYVNDPTILFTTSSTRLVKKEGEDCMLACLLTDPNATEFSLRMHNGSSVPPGMNYTVDPKRGVLIRNLHPSFNADYVCVAKVRGLEKASRPFSINVIQKLRSPPYVFLEADEYVRIVGEQLRIRCSTHNPNFYYNVTWTHSSRSLPAPEEKSHSEGNRLDIVSILTIPSVKKTDTGNITCVGVNEAGTNSTITHLQVVDGPYIRLSPWLQRGFARQGTDVEVSEGEDLELRVLIEAYPQILEKRWGAPSSRIISELEQKFYTHNNRYEAILLLKRMNFGEQGQYTFYAKSSKANASISFNVRMYQKPVAEVRWENISTLTCTSFGYPAPQIFWYQCSGIRPSCSENVSAVLERLPAETVEVQRERYGPVGVESVLTVGPSSHRMTVECVASNLAGVGSDTFAMEVSHKLFTPTLVGAAAMAALFLLLLLILLYKYKQKPRYEIRWKIIEASDGNNYTFIDPSQLPYNEKWEFPRDKLKLGKILGAGAFGKVVEAMAYGLGKEDNVMQVAVKMLKPSAHPEEKEALISELKILSHLGQHKNIVNLLGACTHGGPVLVITEYCCHGDLLNFLRCKAETFLNCVIPMPEVPEETGDYKNLCIDKKYIRSDSGISSSCSDNYLDMKPGTVPGPAQGPAGEDDGVDTWPLDMDDLLRFSLQVSQGLDFLAARNCIHRDVAARNVLLTDGRVAKICDFGLARDIMNDSNYVVKGNARLPVKWMAPESIFDCVYTVQSDVWSYGILLWEIFSLGKSPYPSILVDTKFYKMIKCGYQMSRPNFAPPEMYSIMKLCWSLEPTDRPTFSKISQLIQRLLGDEPEQKVYENVDADQLEGPPEPCDATQCCEGSCDQTQSCDQDEEEQPLMNANNYQLC